MGASIVRDYPDRILQYTTSEGTPDLASIRITYGLEHHPLGLSDSCRERSTGSYPGLPPSTPADGKQASLRSNHGCLHSDADHLSGRTWLARSSRLKLARSLIS